MKKRWISLILILLLATLLALLFEDVLRQAIVIPVLYGYWFVRLYVESLSQSFLWALFIGAAVIIMGRSLLQGGKRRRQPRGIPEIERRSQIESWAERVRLASHGHYFQMRLARHLAELSLDTIAYRERLAAEEIRQRLQRGTLQAPEEIQAYLRTGLAMEERPSLLESRERFRGGRKTSPLHLQAKFIVQFLEELLYGSLRRSGEAT